MGTEAHLHPDHGITRKWDAKDIDVVVKARERARKSTSRKNRKNTKP
jgi:hypothetical protein